MKRLTHKAGYEAGYKLNKGAKEWQAADRLGAYENTGLTPLEITELKERDTAMEINEIHVDEYYCPACGSENNCDQGVVEDNFCPRCGHRLKKGGGEDDGKIIRQTVYQRRKDVHS